MTRLIFSVFHIVLLAQATKSCIFKAKLHSPKELKLPGPWNVESITRKSVSCECGKSEPGKVPPWNLFIHVSSDKKVVICSGTIITSNFVATSHECVRAPGKSLHIYDAWNISPEHKGFVKLNEIRITSSVDESVGETFPVLELIPNPQYLVSWATKSESVGYDNLDLLLLKVMADFTNHTQHSPICIPEDSTHLDFVGQMGYYYSAEEITSRTIHEGRIFTRKMCQNGIDNVTTATDEQDKVSGLCFRWINQVGLWPPRDIGGPVLLKSKSQHSFLAGIAWNVTAKTGTYFDHAYFSNIIPMIKYLEYRAQQHNSSWCKSPQLELIMKPSPPVATVSKWPWEKESIQQTFKDRKESLDCVCGVPNKELTGKIVGGVNATPYEFGWMVGLIIGRSSFCGGSIINNRMILTASHCLVHRGSVAKPENVVVNINMHSRQGDKNAIAKKVESVIVHPNYIRARRKGYFDYDIGKDQLTNSIGVPLSCYNYGFANFQSALLVLKDELKFLPLPEEPVKEHTPNLRPICLPKMGEVIPILGEQAMVSGWGLIDADADRRTPADTLQKIELPIIPLEDCRGIARARITNRFLCAGSLNKYKDAAAGDSGGPLSIMRGRQWTEVGIVSWEDSLYNDKIYIGTAALYTDVTNPAILPIIDYFATRTGAQWCKSEIS